MTAHKDKDEGAPRESWDEDPTHVEPGNPLAEAHREDDEPDRSFNEPPTLPGTREQLETDQCEETAVDPHGATPKKKPEEHSPPGDYPIPPDDTTVA